MKVLFIGDIIGKPGRTAVRALVPRLRQQQGIDLVIANGENSAGGIGITSTTAQELFQSGIDVITTGNHIWKHKEIVPYLGSSSAPVLRPLNFPPGVPGKGSLIHGQVMVVSLLGRVFMGGMDCPFQAMDRLLNEGNPKPRIVLIDFHAEATSEKNALGVYLDGRVSAVVGTHTHVGTVDARVLPKGTAFVTDIGMVGPKNSVIGDDAEGAIHRFLTQMPHMLSVGKGPVIFNSVLVEIEDSGRATRITRIDTELPES
ncbi:MAG: TIGR00282 family metallophosphoesterase [Dehalococcoidia bacterium]|nr:TIGR00282 family metallophosphoesterase [Dehalococcoidia bacterium]